MAFPEAGRSGKECGHPANSDNKATTPRLAKQEPNAPPEPEGRTPARWREFRALLPACPGNVLRRAWGEKRPPLSASTSATSRGCRVRRGISSSRGTTAAWSTTPRTLSDGYEKQIAA